jgi:hypothetical protein
MQKVNTTAIILSAGISNRMKSYEPRSLLKINDSTLAEIQIENFRQRYDGEIILVAGFRANKVSKKLTKLGVQVIENKDYLTTSAFESLRLAIFKNMTDSACVIHGDILFNPEALEVDHSKSFIIADYNGQIHDREVGLITMSGEATTLSYGLPLKWGQIAYLSGEEYDILERLCLYDSATFSRRLWFEAINHIIDLGGKFKCLSPENMKLIEIDAIGDIKNENFDS